MKPKIKTSTNKRCLNFYRLRENMNILDWDESENPYEHISVKHKRYIGAEAFKKELSEILPGCYSELHGATRTPEGVLCIGRLTTPDDFLTDELSKNPPIIIL